MDTNARAKLRAAIERQLEPEERLRWTQTPDPAAHARRECSTLVFACVWLGFIGACTHALWPHLTSCDMLIPLSVILPMWIFGLYLASSAHRARLAARRMIYAVTDRRAIILFQGRALRVRSFYPRDLGSVTLVERQNGFGDVILRHDSTVDGEGGRALREVGFFGIEDPASVKRLLNELAAGGT